jgi:hypothetical protein
VVGTFRGHGGRYHSVYGLGQSLIMAPLSFLGGGSDAWLVTLINPVATALTAAWVLLAGLRLGFSLRAATRVALVFGLATLAWPQSKLTFEAPLEAACLTGALLLVLDGRRGAVAGAGAAFGFALLTRPTAVAMLGGLVYLVYASGASGASGASEDRGSRWRRVAAFAAGAAPFVAGVLAHNVWRWGAPLASGYRLTQHTYFAADLVGLAGLVVSPGRGFFWYSPVLLLIPLGARRLAARHLTLALGLALLGAGYLAVFGASTVWHGDWTFGPRHLLPLVPAASLLLLPLVERGGAPRGLLGPVIAVSVLVQLTGVLVSYDAYRRQVAPADPRQRASLARHWHVETAQIPVQAELAVEMLADLPARLASYARGREAAPYRPLLQTSPMPHIYVPPILARVPDVWWVYLPLEGVPGAALAALAALCASLIVLGARELRPRAIEGGLE